MTKPFKNFNPQAYPKGSITQFFGENKDLYSTLCAAPGVCLTGGHNGWDCVDAWGTPLVSVCDGIIVEVKDDSTGYGKHIRILQDIGDNYLEWVYGHMSRIDVVAGQYVKAGDQVGLMGNTGFVVSGPTSFWKGGYNPYSGTHLHIGVREIKKGSKTTVSYLNDQPDKRITGEMLNYTNGFLGSIDPQPFFSEVQPVYNSTNPSVQTLILQLKSLWNQLLALRK